MSNLNKAQIIGRLGQDPTVNYTQSNTAVANMSVATTEKYKNQNGEMVENTEWFKIVAWGRLAEICQEYLKKGALVYFEGPIQTKEWTDKEGVVRYSTEIKALNMIMLDSKSEGQSNNTPSSRGKQTKQAPPVDIDDGFDDMDDDLPF